MAAPDPRAQGRRASKAQGARTRMRETRPRALPGPPNSPIAGLNVEPIRKPTESGRIAIPAASALRPSPAWSQIEKVRKNAASAYSVVKAPSALQHARRLEGVHGDQRLAAAPRQADFIATGTPRRRPAPLAAWRSSTRASRVRDPRSAAAPARSALRQTERRRRNRAAGRVAPRVSRSNGIAATNAPIATGRLMRKISRQPNPPRSAATRAPPSNCPAMEESRE